MRESLALWLGMCGWQTRLFASGEDFLQQAQPDLRGCAIVDVRLTGMNGLEVQRQLGQCGVTLPVIFITGHGDISMARNALKAGAFDFIEKPLENDKLVALVRAALADDACRAERAASARQVQARLARLTPRERQVMEHVVSGRHNREIAAALGISSRTVEIYKARLMEKLDVRRVPDLVRLALERGIESTPAP